MKPIAHYKCKGLIRGECEHRHRTFSGALTCLRRDRDAFCDRPGRIGKAGYSDREISRYLKDGTERTIDIRKDATGRYYDAGNLQELQAAIARDALFHGHRSLK